MVLRDGGEALVEEVLEAVVVRLDDETMPPQVRPLVPHSEDKPYELPLISGEGAMAGRHRPAEEGDRVSLLDKHGPKTIGGRVTLHDEGLGEVRQGQHRG